MTITDTFILIFVVLVLGLIVYFRFIRKSRKDKLNCYCYKRNSCNLKVQELKDILKKHD